MASEDQRPLNSRAEIPDYDAIFADGKQSRFAEKTVIGEVSSSLVVYLYQYS
jgi:hypothetical protein